MYIFHRYIMSRILGPFLLITFSLTGIVWLMQSMRFIDFIVNRGLDVGTFMYFSMLLVPSLLSIIMPIALFISILITYNKLSTESELLVFGGAGISTAGLFSPALKIALVVMVAGYFISLILMPLSYREFKDMQSHIRDNYISVLLQAGVFNTPTKGLTVYLRSIHEDGNVRGILVHDNRDRQNPITMMAEEGKLVRTKQGPRFILMNGNRQEINHEANNLSLLYFSRYAIDLSTFAEGEQSRWREPRERFIHELFYPEDDTPQSMHSKLAVEGHMRLMWPLYSVALVFLAMVPFFTGNFNRRGQAKKIMLTAVACTLLLVCFLGLKNMIAQQPGLVPLIYAQPLLVMFVTSIVLFRPTRARGKVADEIT